MDFREDDGKGNYSACPKDKDVFKFRCGADKRVNITVTQAGPMEIKIERYALVARTRTVLFTYLSTLGAQW